jgi:hypothetical protein
MHPAQFSEAGEVREVDGVLLRPYRSCLLHHFMVGFDNPIPSPKSEREDV